MRRDSEGDNKATSSPPMPGNPSKLPSTDTGQGVSQHAGGLPADEGPSATDVYTESTVTNTFLSFSVHRVVHALMNIRKPFPEIAEDILDDLARECAFQTEPEHAIWNEVIRSKFSPDDPKWRTLANQRFSPSLLKSLLLGHDYWEPEATAPIEVQTVKARRYRPPAERAKL